jgi:predicted DNA-binding protein (UPF0251 family)
MNTSKKEPYKRGPFRVAAMGIKQRCYNPKCPTYSYYGAKGVGMAPEWKNDYPAFEAYCRANGWKEGLEIHRKGDVGNYEPGNIEFVTPQQHARLGVRIKLSEEKVKEIQALFLNGFKQREIACKMGISQQHVSSILKKKGWSDITESSQALAAIKPINPRAEKLNYKTIFKIHEDRQFKSMNFDALAAKYNVCQTTIVKIIKGKIWKDAYHQFRYLMLVGELFCGTQPHKDLFPKTQLA